MGSLDPSIFVSIPFSLRCFNFYKIWFGSLDVDLDAQSVTCTYNFFIVLICFCMICVPWNFTDCFLSMKCLAQSVISLLGREGMREGGRESLQLLGTPKLSKGPKIEGKLRS